MLSSFVLSRDVLTALTVQLSISPALLFQGCLFLLRGKEFFKTPKMKVLFRETCLLMTAMVLLESMGPIKLKTYNIAEVLLELGPKIEGKSKLSPFTMCL